MIFIIIGWVEVGASYLFNTKTDNLTHIWFGTYIFRNNSRLLIFWYKETIVKHFLKKSHCNINGFDSICNPFILNHTNSIFVILPV